MMHLRKPALLAAGLVLLGGTATACGGGAPSDASEEDFCKAYSSFFDSFSDATEQPSDADLAKALNDWGSELEETGTPEDIPDDAREGFDVVVDALKDINEEDVQNEGEDFEKQFSDDDEKKADAFDDYATDTCGDSLLGG